MLNTCSLLILSDIHFGRYAFHSDFKANDQSIRALTTNVKSMKLDLIRAVQGLNLQLDGIIVPGDLTSIASPKEFIGCINLVNEIASSIHVSPDKIFYTFGNHDLDWSISKLSTSQGASEVDEGYLTDVTQRS